MEEIKDNRVSVQYKFKNSDEIHVNMLTLDQMENLKKIELIEYCEIINN